jgi:NADH:ubiquinone oxidoreductase subunit C
MIELLTALRDDATVISVRQLHRFCGVDYPGRERFDVVYHLLSPRQNQRIRVKVEPMRTHAGAVDHRALSGRRLVRARSL